MRLFSNNISGQLTHSHATRVFKCSSLCKDHMWDMSDALVWLTVIVNLFSTTFERKSKVFVVFSDMSLVR